MCSDRLRSIVRMHGIDRLAVGDHVVIWHGKEKGYRRLVNQAAHWFGQMKDRQFRSKKVISEDGKREIHLYRVR